MKQIFEKIKYRILLLVSFIIILILGLSVYSIYWMQGKSIEENTTKQLNGLSQAFQKELDEDIEHLQVFIEFIITNKELQNAWLSKNRAELLRAASPIFNNILKQIKVTHFYFITPEKVCFLRAHNPGRYGDTINRITLDKAASTKKPASGIELGVFGTFTLRLVHPWYINNKLVGYIELGEEIKHITPILSSILNLELTLLINKNYLNRSDYEEGLRMLNKKEDWDILPKHIIIDQTINLIPDEITGLLTNIKKGKFSKIDIMRDNKIYYGGLISLTDVGKRNVGVIIALDDITEIEGSVNSLLIFLIILSLLAGSTIIFLFYIYINRAEELKIIKSKLEHLNTNLQSEVNERTEEIKKISSNNQLILENIGEGVYGLDLKGNCTFINSKAAKILGYEVEELIGKMMHTNHHYKKPDGSKYEREDCPIYKAFKDGKTHRVSDEVFFRKDGSFFQVEYTSAPIIKGRNILGAVVVFKDITEQKEAVKKILQLSRGLEQSPAMVTITDTGGIIEYANPKVTEITGYTAEELIGKNVNILSSGQTPQEIYDELWETILQGKVWKGEILNKKKNGELYWDLETIAPIINNEGDIINFIAIREDITEKKKMTEDLIVAKEKAEEMNKIKSNFYANMSHELRTPLVGILGFSEILKEESENEELKEYSSMIYSSAFRLQRTLNLVLDFSKIEENKFKLDIELININTFVKNEFDLFKIEAEKEQLDYKLNFSSDAILIKTDKRILGTIISHIIDNAIKYTNNGFVDVNVDIVKEEHKKHLTIEVKDSGKGIEKDKLNLIWEEFRQVSEGLARKYEGVGLGLSIVKKFVGLLKGSIDIKSEFGIGSSFCVKIPIQDDSSEKNTKIITVTDIKKDRPSYKEKVILVVEDEPINSIAITKFLDKTYSVEVAPTPKDALEMCKLNNYALVLMDINLKSNIDGIELMKELKKERQSYNDIPFVAQTAYAMIQDKQRIMNSGFNDYISKPYTRNALLEIVRKNLIFKVAS